MAFERSYRDDSKASLKFVPPYSAYLGLYLGHRIVHLGIVKLGQSTPKDTEKVSNAYRVHT